MAQRFCYYCGMKRYFATFPAGTYALILRHLKSFKLDELKIIEHDESSVGFDSSMSSERLIELRYFTNIYLAADDVSSSNVKGKGFRLMLLEDGKPSQMDVSGRARLEAQIKQRFGLEPASHAPKNDFYLIKRQSGTELLTLRLPKAKFKREKLSAGELRPELAHILCLAAGLKAKHVVIDIFAGYGSIPLEAVRGFGCKQVIAVDTQVLPRRHEHPSILWYTADARKLDFLADNSVDRVVTDPPWGVFDTSIGDLLALYEGCVREVARILKPGGVVVILSGYNNIDSILAQQKKLKLIKKWNVLVSSKKADIYKLQKLSD